MIELLPLYEIIPKGAPSVAWMNQHVPLWVAIVAAFTSPYRWAGYIKGAVHSRLGSSSSGDSEPAVGVSQDGRGKYSIALKRDEKGRFVNPEKQDESGESGSD